MDRREFLKKGGRWITLSGLLAMSGIMLYRRNSEMINCKYNFLCGNCKQLKTCKLPKGMSYKAKR